MKKYCLLFLFVVLSFQFAVAQDFAVGLRGGLNQYKIGDINSRGGSIQSGQADEVFSPNSELGFQFGAFVDIEFGKFFVRPELNYVSMKNSYPFPNRDAEWASSKINVPLLLGYKVYEPFSVYAGLSFNFFNDMTLEGANNLANATSIEYEKNQTNLAIGIQANWKRFGVDLRYELGMQETEEEFQDFLRSAYGINLGDIYAYKPSMISLSINIYLFRTNAEDIGGIFSGLFRNNKCYCPY